MKVIGIIAEFNPFHYGHKYLIDKAREASAADVVMVAMSPNFVMRGEPAIFDKAFRTKIALENGVDLVLEIPTIYAIQSADVFAYKGVQILNALKCNELFFGVETSRTDLLIAISKASFSNQYKSNLKKYLLDGNSFNASSKKALIEINKDFEDVLNQPNNLLAIEYLKAIKKLNSSLVPRFIKRVDAMYFDKEKKDQKIQSASALREKFVHENNMKYFSYYTKSIVKHVKNDYFNLIKYRILSASPKELSAYLGVTEGIENRLINIKDSNSFDEAVMSLITRRDRETKISRIFMAILLNIKKEESVYTENDYIRAIGFNSVGQKYLKLMKDENISVYTTIKRGLSASVYRELDFTRIYYLPHAEVHLDVDEYQPVRI